MLLDIARNARYARYARNKFSSKFYISIEGGGVVIGFRKASFLSVSRRNFFLKFQGVLGGSKRDSVNLTFNAFLNRKCSPRCIMVPGGRKGVV